MSYQYLVEIAIEEEADILFDWGEEWFDTFREAFAFMVAFNNDPQRIKDRRVAYGPERVDE